MCRLKVCTCSTCYFVRIADDITGPSPGTLKVRTQTNNLDKVGFDVSEDRDWPEFDPEISDFAAFFNDNRSLPRTMVYNIANEVHRYSPHALEQSPQLRNRSGDESQPPGGRGTTEDPFSRVGAGPPPRPMKQQGEQEQAGGSTESVGGTNDDLMEDDDELLVNNPTMLSDIKIESEQVEHNLHSAVTRSLDESGIMHERRHLIPIARKPVQPTWQESQVSRAYASANIWGKIKLHEAVIRHQLLELEAEQWEIQCRRNTIEESAERLKQYKRELIARLKARETFQKTLAAGSAAHAALEHEVENLRQQVDTYSPTFLPAKNSTDQELPTANLFGQLKVPSFGTSSQARTSSVQPPSHTGNEKLSSSEQHHGGSQ
jgi:hypothetical protein